MQTGRRPRTACPKDRIKNGLKRKKKDRGGGGGISFYLFSSRGVGVWEWAQAGGQAGKNNYCAYEPELTAPRSRHFPPTLRSC